MHFIKGKCNIMKNDYIMTSNNPNIHISFNTSSEQQSSAVSKGKARSAIASKNLPLYSSFQEDKSDWQKVII